MVQLTHHAGDPYAGGKVTKAYKLLSIAQEYAPNATAQQQLTTIYNKMIEERETEEYIERALIGIMHDGVAHGNWPWNN